MTGPKPPPSPPRPGRPPKSGRPPRDPKNPPARFALDDPATLARGARLVRTAMARAEARRAAESSTAA